MSTAWSEVWASGSITNPFRYPSDDVAWLGTWQGLHASHIQYIHCIIYMIISIYNKSLNFTYQILFRYWNFKAYMHSRHHTKLEADSLLSLCLWHIFTNADSHSELDRKVRDHIGLPLKSRQSVVPKNKFWHRHQLPLRVEKPYLNQGPTYDM